MKGVNGMSFGHITIEVTDPDGGDDPPFSEEATRQFMSEVRELMSRPVAAEKCTKDACAQHERDIDGLLTRIFDVPYVCNFSCRWYLNENGKWEYVCGGKCTARKPTIR